MLTLDNDLEASLLLVNILWEQLAPQFSGELIAAVPARNILVVTGSGISGGLSALERGVKSVWNNPHTSSKLLLTPSLLIRRQTTWQLL